MSADNTAATLPQPLTKVRSPCTCCSGPQSAWFTPGSCALHPAISDDQVDALVEIPEGDPPLSAYAAVAESLGLPALWPMFISSLHWPVWLYRCDSLVSLHPLPEVSNANRPNHRRAVGIPAVWSEGEVLPVLRCEPRRAAEPHSVKRTEKPQERWVL
jgi:hypothetical protein